MKFIKSLLSPFPATEDLSNLKIVVSVLRIGFVGTLVSAIIEINRAQMIALGIAFLISIWFATHGYISFARWIPLVAALGIIASLVVNNNGIRDTAIIGLVVVLISAGLLTGKQGTLIFGLLIFLFVVTFGFLEAQGFIVNQFSQFNAFADYLTIILCIALIAALQWLMIDQLNKNTNRANQELQVRKQVEQQLREAETQYRNLVERIPAVIYIAEPGKNGQWQYVSPQITQLTGFTPGEWLKDPHLWYDLIHPDDRSQSMMLESQALNAGSMPHLEYRLRTREGKYIWVYDEGLLSLGTDNKVLIQGFMLDITALKAAEEQLRKRLMELDAVRGVSEALIAKSDLQNLIEHTGEQIRITFNAASLFISLLDATNGLIHFPYYFDEYRRVGDIPLTFGKGMTASVLKTMQPLLINKNWEETSAQHGVIYYDNKPVKSSLTVPLLTGDRAIGAISMQDMQNEDTFTENDVRLLSTIAANLAVAIENTRLQESLKRELAIQEKLISQLESKNAELERFTYTASHDLKSPLITIRGFLGYLEQDARNGNFERLNRDVRRISEATEKMHLLLNELLELSRIGRVINEPKHTPFEEIVREALERVEGQLSTRQVQVRVGSDLPQVFGDTERLIEVVQNLVDNACKFMGEQKNPSIEIGAQKQADANIFYVKDNGIGINKDFHDKVFGLFDKLDPNSNGTGIGLALVKRIIEVHGGKIWFDSQGEGQGTCFYFTLPENNTPHEKS